MATATRRDIGRVKVRDVDFDAHQDVLLARMRAVLAAQQAAGAGEVGAHPALRQSLVDLAAIANPSVSGLDSRPISWHPWEGEPESCGSVRKADARVECGRGITGTVPRRDRDLHG